MEALLSPLSSRACDFFDLFVPFAHLTRSSTTPQSRHPERSASQIRRIKKDLRRGVEGPRRCLLTDALLGFPTTNYKGNQKVTSSERSASQMDRVPSRCHPISIKVALAAVETNCHKK